VNWAEFLAARQRLGLDDMESCPSLLTTGQDTWRTRRGPYSTMTTILCLLAWQTKVPILCGTEAMCGQRLDSPTAGIRHWPGLTYPYVPEESCPPTFSFTAVTIIRRKPTPSISWPISSIIHAHRFMMESHETHRQPSFAG